MTDEEKQKEIQRLESLLAEQNKEYDRLDNMGSQDVRQHQIGDSIERITKKLRKLKGEDDQPKE